MLRLYDPEKGIRIETDASDLAIEACLSQEYDGKQHSVAYLSRKLSPAEQNHDVHDKEPLAIVVALENWRVYAEGSPKLEILTDHKNLLHFTTTKQLNRRQVRWSELLGQYKFKIQYTPGKENGRADALSRRSDLMQDKKITNHSILKINQDGTLSANVKELNATLRILKDDEEQYSVVHDKLQIPEDKIEQCIKKHHDGILRGHPGVSKTIQFLRRKCHFPNMRQHVETYIKRCLSCQKNKHATHAKYGHIQYQEPSEAPWNDITMDFITKLPSSKNPINEETYDSIFVMVDKLTKYIHVIPFKESYTAVQLGEVFIDRLIRYHGLPKSITSDRDKLFTSKYWKTLIAKLGTKFKLSTAYHSETDGQTERTNQSLEQYLRHYINSEHNNWVSLLPIAQLVLNSKESETTGTTPFFANYGKHPRLMGHEEGTPFSAQDAEERLSLMRDIQQRIKKMHNRSSKNANKKRKMAPQLKKGDKVYLLTKNLRTKRPSKKLDHVKVGPFLIDETRGPVNYKLRLPKDARIHPVSHISVLEPADPDTPIQETFHFESDEREYEVEKILEKRG